MCAAERSVCHIAAPSHRGGTTPCMYEEHRPGAAAMQAATSAPSALGGSTELSAFPGDVFCGFRKYSGFQG